MKKSNCQIDKIGKKQLSRLIFLGGNKEIILFFQKNDKKLLFFLITGLKST